MDIRPVSDEYAVSAQIDPSDVAAVKAAGYRSIICHRPDGEQPGQPTAAEVRKAAHAAGLSFHHIPVPGTGMTAQNVAAMREALASAEAPVFAYCRSGARSTNIYLAATQG